MGKKKGKKKIVDNEDVDDIDIEDVDMDVMTDSDEEYTEAERKLLKKVREKHTPENFDSDDEVYGLGNEVEEEEDLQSSMESDIEELQEDDDIPDDRAWGRKARNFYSSDYKYTDYSSATQKDFANAEMEEQEAKKLHTRSADEIFDFIDDRFIQITEDSKNDSQENDEQTLEFSKSSKKHQQILAQKEYRAFTVLLMDFKVLKAKGLPTQLHPVIKRLEQYRHLLGQLESGEGNLLKEVAEIVKAVDKGKPLYNILDLQKSKEKFSRYERLNKKLKHRKEMLMQDNQELLPDIMDMDSVEEFMNQDDSDIELKYDDKDKGDEEDEEDELDKNVNEEEKRAITYQIAKNRGLTPYRKKELRNPRVKHRNKYRKAKIRRKGAVREVRKELTRYGGEIFGIKAGVKKSIKLK